MRKIFAASFFLFLTSCINGSIKIDQICNVQTFRTIPGGIPVPSGKLVKSGTTDMSQPISELSKFGSVKVKLTAIRLTSVENIDLSFVKNVQIDHIKKDGSIIFISKSENVSNQKEIEFRTFSNEDVIVAAVAEGPVRIRVSGESESPPEDITPVLEVCAEVESEVDYSIDDIH